jgi:hypothetical protein
LQKCRFLRAYARPTVSVTHIGDFEEAAMLILNYSFPTLPSTKKAVSPSTGNATDSRRPSSQMPEARAEHPHAGQEVGSLGHYIDSRLPEERFHIG